MRWIIEWSLKFQLFAIALAFILVVICFIQMQTMPVDALPEFAPLFIEIQTETPGLSTREVEELVTFNLEELLNGTPWLQSIRSISVPGLSAITLTFQPGTDILRARQLVSERLSLAYTLPNVAEAPVILQPLSAMSRIMMAGLTSKDISPIDMSVLAYWNIRPALLSVPGVANVAIWGLRYKQLQVEVNPSLLQPKNINLDQIVSTTGNALWVSPLSFLNASAPGSDGWIDSPQQRIEIRHVLPISTPHDLAKINIEGSKLSLGDLTTITTGFPPLIGDDVVNDGAGLLVLIDKFPGANTLDVTRKIEEKLAALQPALSGIKMDTSIFRPAGFVETTIGNMSTTLAIGFVGLLLALLLLTQSWRAVLVCLIVIVVSLASALLILNLLGTTINIMILAGLMIAIAIIIDEVILDVECLFFSEPSRKVTLPTSIFILTKTLNNRSSMFSATLIILLTLLPIYLLDGFGSSFFQPLVIAYGIAVIVAMLVAWFITPAICLLLLPKQTRALSNNFFFTRFQQHYQRSLAWLANSSSSILVTCSIVLAFLTIAGFILFLSFQKPPLLPEFKEQDILVQWEGPPGTSIEEMVRITTRASRELRAVHGVQNVAVAIGRAVLGDKIVNVNSAQLIIRTSPQANYHETITAIKKIVAGYPGISHVVQTYLKDRMQQTLTGTPSDIVVRIFGHDFRGLHNKAHEVKKLLSPLEGITDVHLDREIVQPEIAIEVNLAKAQQYGLKPGDVRRATATLVAGLQVGSLFDEQKIFPVVVWGMPDLRHSLDSLHHLLINTPNGKWVRLDEVADISIKPSPNFIQHETVSRLIDIDVNVRGRNVTSVVNEIKEKLKSIKFPLEYHAEVLGAYQQYLLAKEHLLLTIVAIAVLIFLLLQAIFKSFKLAAVILFTLPLALIGSVLMVIVIDCTSTISLVGMLAVLAITIRNTIMSIVYFQTNQLPLASGASTRLIPIMLTMCAVIVALLPFIILFNRSGLEIAGPAAAIIMSGMITSTIYTGLIVPIFYLGFGKSQ